MATTQQTALAEALSAIETGVAKPVQAPRLTYAEARADLDARARAGKTVQGRNSKGHFTKGVKVFTAGKAPVAQAPAKVEKVAASPKDRARAVWLNEAASLRRMVASARRNRDVPALQIRDEAAAIERARQAVDRARYLRTSVEA